MCTTSALNLRKSTARDTPNRPGTEQRRQVMRWPTSVTLLRSGARPAMRSSPMPEAAPRRQPP
eukprot:1852742-Lingulodinium_polyedra.AAC.1